MQLVVIASFGRKPGASIGMRLDPDSYHSKFNWDWHHLGRAPILLAECAKQAGMLLLPDAWVAGTNGCIEGRRHNWSFVSNRFALNTSRPLKKFKRPPWGNSPGTDICHPGTLDCQSCSSVHAKSSSANHLRKLTLFCSYISLAINSQSWQWPIAVLLG